MNRYRKITTYLHIPNIPFFHSGGGKALIDQLEICIRRGFSLILTSHHEVEGLKEVQIKIDYLRRIKKLAAESSDTADFKAKAAAEFPEYTGGNYLDMTAGFFFS